MPKEIGKQLLKTYRLIMASCRALPDYNETYEDYNIRYHYELENIIVGLKNEFYLNKSATYNHETYTIRPNYSMHYMTLVLKNNNNISFVYNLENIDKIII